MQYKGCLRARGVKKNGGRVLLNAHVEGIELEGGRAVGVRLRGGARICARRAVVSNASMWDTQVRPNLPSNVTCMLLGEQLRAVYRRRNI